MPVTRRSTSSPTVAIPPHNYDLERGVLGAAFYQPHLTQAVAAADTYLFWHEQHRDIHATLRELLPKLNGRVPQVDEILAEAAAQGVTVTRGTLLEIESAGASAVDVAVPLGQLAELAAQREEAGVLATVELSLSRSPDKQEKERGLLLADMRDRLRRADEFRDQADKVQPALQVARAGDKLTYSWPSLRVEFDVDLPRAGSDGFSAEVTVRHRTRVLHWARLNLSSGPTRTALVKTLKDSVARVDWRPLLEEICTEATKTYRQGNPVVFLTPSDHLPTNDELFLVEPLVCRGDTTVIFGDGGSCKGYLALLCAIGYVTDEVLVKLIPHGHGAPPGNVLVLDWETNEEDHNRRLGGLLRGLGIDEAKVLNRILYKQMDVAFTEQVSSLRSLVVQQNITLVIVDSLGPASGADSEGTNASVTTMTALRSLGPNVTRLVVAHVSKAMADSKLKARPFGSVFNQNLPRATWEVVADSDTEPGAIAKSVGVFNRKNNNGLRHPMAFTFHFDKHENRIAVHSTKLASIPALASKGSQKDQILGYMAEVGGPVTAKQIAEATGLDRKSQVSPALSKMGKDSKVVLLPGDLWALVAHQQAEGYPEPGADLGEEFQGGDNA